MYPKITSSTTLLYFLLILIPHHAAVKGKIIPELTTFHPKTLNSSASPWLRRNSIPRQPGCLSRPWICKQESGAKVPRIKRLCCRNRCVELTSDVNNCGFCGTQCKFTQHCCRGLSVDMRKDPFHCGGCGNRCGYQTRCAYGLCGYAKTSPAFPLPIQSKRPKSFPFPLKGLSFGSSSDGLRFFPGAFD